MRMSQRPILPIERTTPTMTSQLRAEILSVKRSNLARATHRQTELREEMLQINKERHAVEYNLHALADCVKGLTAEIAELQERSE